MRRRPGNWQVVEANPLTREEADALVRAALPAIRRLLEAYRTQIGPEEVTYAPELESRLEHTA